MWLLEEGHDRCPPCPPKAEREGQMAMGHPRGVKVTSQGSLWMGKVTRKGPQAKCR